MKAAVLIYRKHKASVKASLAWVDPIAGRLLQALAVPSCPNFTVLPGHDCLLVHHTEYPERLPARHWLDIYRLSDGSLRARRPMNCGAHFNFSPRWPVFLSSPEPGLFYIYKSRTLGNHRSDDYVCGFDLERLDFTSWDCQIPECVSGWSGGCGRSHAQMLFVSDGLEVGRLPVRDLEQKVGFWLGPEEGMGPVVSLGLRPVAHSDLGHARAILSAPGRPLSLVVSTDGAVHLIDPVDFRYLERQQVKLREGYAMPIFGACVEPNGRFLYVGVSREGIRQQGLVEAVVVHDLAWNRVHTEGSLPEPLTHMSLTEDGKYLCGGGYKSHRLWVLDALTGRVEASMSLGGRPQYVIPFSEA